MSGYDYNLDIILQAKAEGMAAFADVNAHMAALVVEAKVASEALKELNESSRQHGQALQSLRGDMGLMVAETSRLAATLEKDLTPAMNNVRRSSDNAHGGLYNFFQGMIPGGRTAGNIVIVLGSLAGVLAGPLVVGLAASLALLGAWVVGMAAFLGVISVVTAGFLALGGAIAVLGIQAAGGLDPHAKLEAAQKSLATATNQNEAAQEALAKAQLAVNQTMQVSPNQHLAVATAQRSVETATISVTQAKERETQATLAVTQAKERDAQAALLVQQAQDRLTAAVARYGASSSQATSASQALERAQFALQTAHEGVARAETGLGIAHENVTKAALGLQGAQDGVTRAQNTVTSSGQATSIQLLTLQQAQEQAAESAQKQADAQKAVDLAASQAAGPVGVLHEKIAAMGQAFGQQALPFVNQAATALIGILPNVQNAGNAIFAWFGPRFPEIMRIAGDAAQGTFGVVSRIAGVWTKMADDVLNHPVEYEKVLGTFVGMAERGIEGLMQNLLRLSDWFIARFPALQKNTETILGGMGVVVQGLGTVLGAVVDWILAHWPAIEAVMRATWEHIREGFLMATPYFVGLRQEFEKLGPHFKYIEENAKNLLPYFIGIGLVIAVVLVLLGAFGIALIELATGIVWLVTKISEFVHAAIPALGGFFNSLGTWIHTAIIDVGGFFSMVGGWANAVVQAFGAAFAAVGSFFSGVGTAVQAALSTIGGFFSAFGSAVKTVTDTIGGFFQAVWQVIQAIANVIGIVMTAIQTIIITALAIILGVFIVIFTGIWNFIAPLLAQIRDLVGAVFSAIGTTINTVLTWVWKNVIEPIWNAILGFLTVVWNTIVQVASVTWTFWFNVISYWIGQARDVVMRVWNAVLGFLTAIWNTIVSVAQITWNFWFTVISNWISLARDFILNVWNQIWNFLVNMWASIKTFADLGWRNIWGTITGWAGSIRDTVQGIWDVMIRSGESFIGNLWGKIKSGLNEVIKVLDEFINVTNQAIEPITGTKETVKPIPLLKMESGGVVPVGAGFKTSGPTAIVGEGDDGAPEYVIPTSQKYRANAIELTKKLAADLGFLAAGGVVGQSITSPWFAGSGTITQLPYGGFSHGGLNAVDIAMGMGTPLRAGTGGIATDNPNSGGYGNMVDFRPAAAAVQIIMGHLLDFAGGGLKGQGQALGRADSTGNSTGSHLHFEVRGGDVWQWLAQGIGSSNGGGGFLGALAPQLPDPGPLIDAAAKVAHGAAGNLKGIYKQIADGVIDKVAAAVKNFASSRAAAASAPAGSYPAAGGQLASWILSAIAATGVPTSWSGALGVLINRESGGNPTAVNRTDSNFAAGHPSQGLAQVIPGTFAAYHQAGTAWNILDPVANIAAAINYIKARYGTIFNVQQANPNLPPQGYDSGGDLGPGYTLAWNGTGRTETVSTAGSMDAVIDRLTAILGELKEANGKPKLSAATAGLRF